MSKLSAVLKLFYYFALVVGTIISAESSDGVSSGNVDSSDLVFLNASASTNTYAQAVNYCKTNPKRDGGSWNGW